MKFSDIIGHTKIKKLLIQTVNEGRISHAQLFLGHDGNGNLPLAIAYAQFISCTNRQANDSCGKCSSCIKYNKLTHPDLHFVFPVNTNNEIKKNPTSDKFLTTWRAVLLNDYYLTYEKWQDALEIEKKQLIIASDESIEIVKKLSLKSYESEYKVMIIWWPEKLNISSANKLLKIIEEPPAKTLFLLVAQDAEQIIPTILSRTQLIKINTLAEDELANGLVEKFNVSNEKAKNISIASDGNINRAIKLLNEHPEQDIYFELFTTWMRLVFKADIKSLLSWVDQVAILGREKQKLLLSYGLRIFRESLILHYGDKSLQRIYPNESGFLLKFYSFINGANCIQIIELFNKYHYHIERNANPKILFADLSFKIIPLLRKK